MIKAIIFDVGGVLLRTEDLAPREKWAQRYGLGVWDFAAGVFESEAANLATIGQASDEEAWQAAEKRFKVNAAESASFRRDFYGGDRWDESLLNFVKSLRGKYRTAILSNAWGGARQFLQAQPLVVEAFEELVISAEEGLRKPQEEIYRRVLNRVNAIPREAIFVDDVLENIQAAQKIGLDTVHFQKGINLPQIFSIAGIQP